MNQKGRVIYYLILSATGAGIVIALSLLGSSDSSEALIFDRLIVGSAFISIAAFGISLALRPGWVRGLSGRGRHAHENQHTQTNTRNHLGHHPDCGIFGSHVVTFRGKTLCSGCTGLALGSAISIVVMVFHIAVPYGLGPTISYIFIILGMVLVALNYLDISTSKGSGQLHLASNVFLVVGFLLVVIGLLEKTSNVAIGLFGVLISVLWMDTRIHLSNWFHALICRKCGEACKAY